MIIHSTDKETRKENAHILLQNKLCKGNYYMHIHKLFNQQNNHTGTDIPERTLSKGNYIVLNERTELYGFTISGVHTLYEFSKRSIIDVYISVHKAWTVEFFVSHIRIRITT